MSERAMMGRCPLLIDDGRELCRIVGCEYVDEVKANTGLCNKHYTEDYKKRKIEEAEVVITKKCVLCDSTNIRSKELCMCSRCYQSKAGKEIRAKNKATKVQCTEPNCHNQQLKGGFCERHYKYYHKLSKK
jgi:hypothetical protein